jgi:hypothetical protein
VTFPVVIVIITFVIVSVQGCGAIYALLVSSSPQRGYTSTRSTGAGAGASSKGAVKRFGESGACEAVAMVMAAHGELCTKTSKMVRFIEGGGSAGGCRCVYYAYPLPYILFLSENCRHAEQ